MSQTFRSYPTCNPALNIALELLTPNGFRLYMLLRTWWHHRRNRYSYYTVTSLARLLNVCRLTIRRHLQELRRKKLVSTYLVDRRQKCTWYILNPITGVYPTGLGFPHPARRTLQAPKLPPPNKRRPIRQLSAQDPGNKVTTNPSPKRGRRKRPTHSRPALNRRSAPVVQDSPPARRSTTSSGSADPLSPGPSPRDGDHLTPEQYATYLNLSPAARRRAEDNWVILAKAFGHDGLLFDTDEPRKQTHPSGRRRRARRTKAK